MTDREMPPNETPSTLACSIDPEQWVDAHGDALFRYALVRVGRRESAEDLVQETFVAAIRARDSFRNTATVRTWLIGILRRKIVDHYRQLASVRSRTGGDAKADETEDPWFDARGSWAKALVSWRTPASIAEDRELWRVLEQCLAKLPRSSASAFVLRELEGLDCDQLQQTLELSPANVRVRLYRARQSLRACLEKNWFQNENASRGAPANGRSA